MKTANAIVRAIATAALLAIAACASTANTPESNLNGQPPAGTVDLTAYQAAYLASGSGGNGVLHFQGADYPFSIGGLGVGGIGVSSIDGAGEVYNLPSVNLFPGAYVQGRYGLAIGNFSRGDLWLKNDAGVVMHLKAKRTGLMLSLGGDAMVITMSKQ